MKHIIEFETEDGSQAESALVLLRVASYIKSAKLRSAVEATPMDDIARQEITRYLNPLGQAQAQVAARGLLLDNARTMKDVKEIGPHKDMPIWVDDRNRLTVLMNQPGESNDAHWHDDFDEWWMVLEGEIDFEIGLPANKQGAPYGEIITIHARKGDLVFCPKGLRHHIRTVGTRTSYRLAVATPAAPHVYTDKDVKEWRGDEFVDASTVEAPSLRQPDDSGPYDERPRSG